MIVPHYSAPCDHYLVECVNLGLVLGAWHGHQWHLIAQRQHSHALIHIGLGVIVRGAIPVADEIGVCSLSLGRRNANCVIPQMAGISAYGTGLHLEDFGLWRPSTRHDAGSQPFP